MSARKVSPSSLLQDNITVQGREARLTLAADSVVILRSGIEFRSPTAFPAWTEMNLALRAADSRVVNCSGVVISCSGSKHAGFHISMIFTGMTKQAQARISELAQSSLA